MKPTTNAFERYQQLLQIAEKNDIKLDVEIKGTEVVFFADPSRVIDAGYPTAKGSLEQVNEVLAKHLTSLLRSKLGLARIAADSIPALQDAIINLAH